MSKETEFIVALQIARARLKTATKTRDKAIHQLSGLSAEIPRLQATIAALSAQVKPRKTPATQMSSAVMPTAVGAPIEVDASMASVPAAHMVEQAQTPEELPHMEGDWS